MTYLFSLLTILTLLCFATGLSPASKAQQPSPVGYDLDEPDQRYVLPPILQEVSGLTALDDRTVACVQDEDGTVFIYNLWRQEIVHRIDFAGGGDYEGITRVGPDMYVLRSDGELYELVDFRSDVVKVNVHDPELPIKESEGLALDQANGRLLIAAKSEAEDGAYAGKKVIFGFDLEGKCRSADPVRMFAAGEEGLNPSGVAIHPFTGHLYVLSSKDHLLYVFRGDDEVDGIYALPKKRFAQPEGIAFLENGDLLIANEGKKKGVPDLLRFSYHSGDN